MTIISRLKSKVLYIKRVPESGSCPLGGQCLLSNKIYQANVTKVVSGKVKTYTVLATGEWRMKGKISSPQIFLQT